MIEYGLWDMSLIQRWAWRTLIRCTAIGVVAGRMDESEPAERARTSTMGREQGGESAELRIAGL